MHICQGLMEGQLNVNGSSVHIGCFPHYFCLFSGEEGAFA